MCQYTQYIFLDLGTNYKRQKSIWVVLLGAGAVLLFDFPSTLRKNIGISPSQEIGGVAVGPAIQGSRSPQTRLCDIMYLREMKIIPPLSNSGKEHTLRNYSWLLNQRTKLLAPSPLFASYLLPRTEFRIISQFPIQFIQHNQLDSSPC